ncbi:MAG TPA: hypothetical protein DCR40_00915 [Prolixibacteraceae bacterium]|nr:hypothetical protein [Prolixibacteraceae bacterium]
MKSAAKLIIWSQETKKGSNLYSVKIRIKEGEKYRYIALPFYLTGSEKNKFVNDKGDLLPSYKNYEKIQTQFKTELKKLNISDPNKITQTITYKSNSFSEYLEKYSKKLEINNQLGLLQKTNTLKYQLELFCSESGRKPDLLFFDINIDFLNDFREHLTLKNVKPVSQKGYLEKFRVILTNAINDEKYNPSKNPFTNFKFNAVVTSPKHLNKQEFKLLKGLVDGSAGGYSQKENKVLKLSEPNKLIGLKWLFQYYSFGMRVSDLLLLRWENITDSGKRLKFTMYKTKSKMDIALNNELLDILFKFMKPSIQTEIIKKTRLPAGTDTLIAGGEEIKYNRKVEKYDLIRLYLYNLSNNSETKNQRIFSKVTSETTDIKKIYTSVATQTAVYNKQLKKLSNEIETFSNKNMKLSSHMARHTFAYLSLMEGKNVYYISKALNHKSIKTTEKYILGFPLDELDGKFYDEEIKIEDKKAIDDKLKEIIANATYEKKKKIVDLFS